MILFDTSADLCLKAFYDPIDKKGLKRELHFGSALIKVVNTIVYAEFDNLTKINESRDVIYNFAELEMNTSELEEILKKIDCTKNTFDGVNRSDLLTLEVKQYSQSLVENVENVEWGGF